MGRGNNQLRRKVAGARARRETRRLKIEKRQNADGQKFEGGWVLLRYLQTSRRARAVYSAESLFLTRPETDAPFAALEKISQARMATAPGWHEGPALAELPMKEFSRGVEYRVVVGPADPDGKPRKAILIPADATEVLEAVARGVTTRLEGGISGRVTLTEGVVALGVLEPAPGENDDVGPGSDSDGSSDGSA